MTSARAAAPGLPARNLPRKPFAISLANEQWRDSHKELKLRARHAAECPRPALVPSTWVRMPAAAGDTKARREPVPAVVAFGPR